MIKLSELQRQLKLNDNEVNLALHSMLIKPIDGEISISDSKRITDWTEGYREFTFGGEQ